jgi:hypothetical protein
VQRSLAPLSDSIQKHKLSRKNSIPVSTNPQSLIINKSKAKQNKCMPVNLPPKSAGVCRENLSVSLSLPRKPSVSSLSKSDLSPSPSLSQSYTSLPPILQTLCTTTQTGGSGHPRLPVQPMLASEQPARSPAYSIVVPCGLKSQNQQKVPQKGPNDRRERER